MPNEKPDALNEHATHPTIEPHPTVEPERIAEYVKELAADHPKFSYRVEVQTVKRQTWLIDAYSINIAIDQALLNARVYSQEIPGLQVEITATRIK